MNMFNKYLSLLFVFVVLLHTACAPQGSKLDTQMVRGVITIKGKPAPRAFVSFEPETNGAGAESASGYADEQGNYMLTSVTGNPQKGALAGNYIVTVACYETVVTKWKDEMGEEQEAETSKLISPEKYSNATTSSLRATVVKGENKLDFDLVP